jgi:hypothetical protein
MITKSKEKQLYKHNSPFWQDEVNEAYLRNHEPDLKPELIVQDVFSFTQKNWRYE